MEKMCVTHIFDKELIFKICDEVIQLQSKNNLILKWSDDINKLLFFFSKQTLPMANRYIRRSSTSVIIREMHIKTTRRCHLTPVRIPVVKRQEIPKFSTDVKKWEPLYSVGEYITGTLTMDNGTQVLQKIKNGTTISSS